MRINKLENIDTTVKPHRKDTEDKEILVTLHHWDKNIDRIIIWDAEPWRPKFIGMAGDVCDDSQNKNACSMCGFGHKHTRIPGGASGLTHSVENLCVQYPGKDDSANGGYPSVQSRWSLTNQPSGARSWLIICVSQSETAGDPLHHKRDKIPPGDQWLLSPF